MKSCRLPADLVYQLIKARFNSPSPTHLICIALEGAEGIGGAMALEVVPAAAGRLHSDQYSKIL